jgi:hypothetical protein
MISNSMPHYDACIDSDDSADDLTAYFVNLHHSQNKPKASAPPPPLKSDEDEAESSSTDSSDVESEIQTTFGVRRSP